MGKRCFAASRGSRDDVERVLGQTTAENLIEAGHACGHLPDSYPFVSLSLPVVH
jgi:hypothetical protein